MAKNKPKELVSVQGTFVFILNHLRMIIRFEMLCMLCGSIVGNL